MSSRCMTCSEKTSRDPCSGCGIVVYCNPECERKHNCLEYALMNVTDMKKKAASSADYQAMLEVDDW